MQFKFSTATQIIFGPDTIKEVLSIISEIGKCAFVVTGHNTKRANPLLELLKNRGIEVVTFNVSEEPTTTLVYKGVQKARSRECTSVIGIGGGSVIDTGKAVAALLTNSGELVDYLEVIGRGKQLAKPPATYIAIPTTAGTGTEVTRNAVIKSQDHHVKVSMRSPLLLPRLAVIDPVLTYSMPPNVTASTGLDALTQLMEVYVSNKANLVTDSISRKGLQRVAISLLRAYENGNDKAARENMSLASLFGGIGLANAKLGAVHGFAGVLGGMFYAPHGVICARLLPFVMESNVSALQARCPDSNALERYKKIAKILTGKNTANVSDGIKWVQNLCFKLKVPPLAEFGLKETDFPTVIEKSKKASSMKGNPIALTDTELSEILKNAL